MNCWNIHPIPQIWLPLTGQRFFFESRGDCSCRGYFADLTKNHYRDGIMALEHCWNKCISLKGDYVEK